MVLAEKKCTRPSDAKAVAPVSATSGPAGGAERLGRAPRGARMGGPSPAPTDPRTAARVAQPAA
eukprot:5916016-Pyramimonas_sp.AAC.1